MASSIGDVAGFVRSQFGDSWQCKRCNVCMSTVAIQALLNARIEPKSMHGCAADEMSDEQLRAECKRRGLDVYDPPPALHEVIDALLPECPGAVAWNAIKARVDELLALEKMVESPKTVVVTNVAVPFEMFPGRVMRFEPTEKGAPKTLSIKEANQLMSEAAANMRRDIESLSDPVLCDGREQGAGIASILKPDNSHYVLDVDLLADDAG